MSIQQAVNQGLLVLNVEQLKRAILVCLFADTPLAIWGGVGIGKSQAVAQVAKKLGYKLYDVRLSDKEPSDLGGIPYPVVTFWELNAKGERTGKSSSVALERCEIDGKVEYLVSGLLPFGADEMTILFFDEVDRTDIGVLNALLQVVLDRRINGHMLGPNVRILMAGNGETDKGTVTLTEAARSRSVHVYIKFELDTWVEWAREENIPGHLIGWAKTNPDDFSNGSDKHFGTGFSEVAMFTPRTSVMAATIYEQSKVMQNEGIFKVDDIIPALIQGCITKAKSTLYLGYIQRLWEKAPTPEEIVADPENVPVPEDPGTLFAISGSLSRIASKDENGKATEAIATYANRWTSEVRSAFFRELLNKQPKVALTTSYQKWNGTYVKPDAAERTHTDVVATADPAITFALVKLKDAKLLPDSDRYVNRIQHYGSTNNRYVISQERSTGKWLDSCRGFLGRDTCQHVEEFTKAIDEYRQSHKE